MLLALSAIFVTYIVSGFLAHPDWGEAGRGLVAGGLPGHARRRARGVATVGTTLAPWGLAFIQSYAVDKRLHVEDLRYERIDVITGAVLTGVIGLFIVVACAATLHEQGRHIHDAKDAAVALSRSPAARRRRSSASASSAPACWPRRSCRSPPRTRSRRRSTAAPTSTTASARRGSSTCAYGASAFVAAALVLIPGAPLVKILFLSQALNAILLLAILPFLRGLARDPEVMGEHRLSRYDSIATAAVIVLVALSVLTLAVLSVVG